MGVVRVFRGAVVHSWDFNILEILSDALLGVDSCGRIAFIEKVTTGSDGQDNAAALMAAHDFDKSSVRQLSSTQLLMPGFIDTHAHAPQFENCGLGMDLPLLDWLQKYTFPTESRFADNIHAKDIYTKLIRRFLRNGTTTACFFSSLHLTAARILIDIADAAGMRTLVGKVNMDRNSPDFYIEDTDTSLRDTETFLKEVEARKNPLLTAVITPRFVPTCSTELMKGLASLAKKYNVPIQSHISENKAEIAWVQELHSNVSSSYAGVYDYFGLLTPRTILAHGIHLSDAELALLQERGTGIAHCPNSNTTLCSGIMPIRRVIDAGVTVGLGSDISGGYATSILDSMRQAVIASKVISIEDSSKKPLDIAQSFYLGTLGGAKLLGIENETGNFKKGKAFDALIVDAEASGAAFTVFGNESTEDLVQKFIFLGDDRNIIDVFVSGKRLHIS